MVTLRRKARGFALFVIGGLLLAACDSGAAATPTAVAPTAAPTVAATVAPTAAPTVAATVAATIAPTTAALPNKVTKIGFLTDGSQVNDKGYNQGIWEGVQDAAAKLGAQAHYIENQDPAKQTEILDQMVASGDNPIVTDGFSI